MRYAYATLDAQLSCAELQRTGSPPSEIGNMAATREIVMFDKMTANQYRKRTLNPGMHSAVTKNGSASVTHMTDITTSIARLRL